MAMAIRSAAYRAAAVVAAAWIVVACASGCTGCRDCGGPVAPGAYSEESGGAGEPSLPYMKPWWL